LFAGVKSILLEKPGGLSINGLKEIEDLARENDAQVFIAYNRRFYSSVQKLKEELFIDGGIQSVHFEFTEWLNTIDPLLHDSEVLNKWIIANSSHVIDTVFSLIGVPKELTSFVGGINKISWHSSGSIFVGSGLSENNIPFTYHSNWDGPGRWGIEIITHHRRFYLKPMEILQQQLKNTIQTSELEFDNQIDHDFKAGLYKQTLAFLDLESDNMLNLSDQIRNFAFYYKIGGYSE
jgi:predicted dehydrogenase